MTDGTVTPPLPVAASRDGGRYTLLSLLGRGGMGEVYLARDERLRRQVAIKRIRAAGENEEHLHARLEQEARVLAQLGHPAIVAVFDIFEDPDGAWVVMELVVGRTLAKVLDEGALGVDDVLSHGIAIAAALDSAHHKGIVHRDLKVENVMLSGSGQIKILDFGLAKRLLPSESTPALSVEGQVMGTVRTMSPEQARGLPVDERSDLFSLGVLLYELLSGLSPFAGATALDTLVRVSTHRQTSLVELPGMAEVIPPALSELVDELLEKAVERRPESAAAVRDRLAAIAAARSPAVRGAPARATPPRGNQVALDQQSTAAMTAATVSLKAPAGRAASEPAPAPEGAPARPSRPAVPGPEPGLAAATVSLRPAGGPDRAAGAPAIEAAPRRRGLGSRRALMAALGAAVAVSIAIGVLGVRAGRDSGADPGSAVAVQVDAPAPIRDPKAEYERGMALLRDFHRPGAIDEAAAIFQRLLLENERSAAAYAGLARAHWRRYAASDLSKDPRPLQQARVAADRAVAIDELFVDARVSHGLVALELGEVAQAEADFQAALALDGRSAAAHGGMARVRAQQQRPAEAEAAYRKALALAPGDHALHDELGALLVQLGRYREASQLFEQSIKLAPDSVYGYSHLGTALFAQGLYGPAATALERARSMGAGDYTSWANLADAYRQLPDSADKAREHYDRAIQLVDSELVKSPRDPTLLGRRALFLAKRGDCPRADAGASSLLDARELPPAAVFRAAVTLEICGQRQRAIAALERSLGGGLESTAIDQDPDLRVLRADPAYQRMLHRLGATKPAGAPRP